MSCIFCEIVSNNIEVEKVFEDDDFLAFKDIYPKAEIHYLVIPKDHFRNILEVSSEIMSKLPVFLVKLVKVTPKLNEGFRTIVNTGENSGQEVFHLHFHILGGEKLKGE